MKTITYPCHIVNDALGNLHSANKQWNIKGNKRNFDQENILYIIEAIYDSVPQNDTDCILAYSK